VKLYTTRRNPRFADGDVEPGSQPPPDEDVRPATRFWNVLFTTALLLLLSLPIVLSRVPLNTDGEAGWDGAEAALDEQRRALAAFRLGLLGNLPEASPGYTLLASANSTKTYLIDMQGRVVRSWTSDCRPGLSAYLLENGNLLRTGQIKNPPFFGGGSGGRIQEFTWDGEIIWDFTYHSETRLPNHDVCKLPNGNVLMIVWEKKSAQDALAAGRRPETVVESDLLAGSILEVQPTGKTTGQIVWEWHSWDHLIQDFEATKSNYGDVASHPERIDLNFGEGTIAAMVAPPERFANPWTLGSAGGSVTRPPRVQPDWLHINGIAYHPDLDQIMLSVHEFNEIWVIDHSTTTAEAASHQGGRYGKGGDLLYRWGNPRAYRAGTVSDQKLFGQHDAHWIAKGLPGEGHVLIFNNGLRRISGAYSTVDEIVLPIDAQGGYEDVPGRAYGPDNPTWTYIAPEPWDFYAPFISGAQRQPNGNTLICSGTNGTVFEVSPQDEIVWKYINPVKTAPPAGMFPLGAPPRGGRPAWPPTVGVPPGRAFPGGAPRSDAPPKDEQRKSFRQMQDMARTLVAGGLPSGPPGGFLGGSPGGFRAFGGDGLFRAPRYAPDFPGLAGKDLTPGKPLEEVQAEDSPSSPWAERKDK